MLEQILKQFRAPKRTREDQGRYYVIDKRELERITNYAQVHLKQIIEIIMQRRIDGGQVKNYRAYELPMLDGKRKEVPAIIIELAEVNALPYWYQDLLNSIMSQIFNERIKHGEESRRSYHVMKVNNWSV